MIQKILVLTACVLMLFSDHLYADTHAQLVRKYLKQSGIQESLASFPDQVSSLSAQNLLSSNDPVYKKKAVAIMKKSFHVKEAQDHFFSFILENTDVAFLKKALDWQGSPLGKKITAEELAAASPQSRDDLLRYLENLEMSPPSKTREAAIRKFEKSTGMSKRSASIIIELIRGMNESINQTLPPGERKTRADLEKELDRMRPMILESMREKFILSSFYTYRNLTDKELDRYTAFYESETGRKELDLTIKAFSHVFRKWFERVMNRIQKEGVGKE